MGCDPTNEELEDMMLCCRYGDLKELEEFVENFGHSWLNSYVDENGNTGLHMATGNGHLEVVNYLLDHLTDKQALLRPNNPPAKNTPLHWAAMNHHLEILKSICPRLTSQEISTVNGRGYSAMSEAVEGAGPSSILQSDSDSTTQLESDQIPMKEQCVNYLVEMMKLGSEEDEGDKADSGSTQPVPVQQVAEEVDRLKLTDRAPVCLR